MSRKRTERRITLGMRVEYAVVRAAVAVFGCLPDRLAVLTGCVLGTMAWLWVGKRRRLARRNIELAMPGELSSAEVRRIVRRVFLFIALGTVENFRLMRRGQLERALRRMELDGVEQMNAERAKGRPRIAVTGHFGNWELLGMAVARGINGFHAFARPSPNPLLDAYLNRLRQEAGIDLLNTEEGIRPLLKVLKEGGAVSVMMDQHVHSSYVRARFFGREAATTAIVASLALRLDAAVFVGYSYREGVSLRHHGYLDGPVELVRTGNHNADILANTQHLNDCLERAVRRRPDQWLWTYKRWRVDELDRTDAGQEEDAAGAE